MKIVSIRSMQEKIDKMSVLQRAAAPVPKFFQKLKLIGMTLAATSGVLLTAGTALPAIVTTIASYMAIAGTVATAVSQVAVDSDEVEN